MEDELKCPVCRRLYSNPVFMPCSHALCLACALSIQNAASHFQQSGNCDVGEVGHASTSNLSEYVDYPDVDKVSLVSETDSGVVCNSRPNSYVGTPSVGSWLFHSILGNTYGICCPTCKKVTLLDEQGANGLPKNRVLENIVDKYGESKQFAIYCQLCEGGSNVNTASEMCEQCEVFYCDSCRENCHPMRGPLAKHNLVQPAEGKALLRAKHRTESSCQDHNAEILSMYCLICKATVCYVCVQEGRHINHEVQPLANMCKSQKVGYI